jgi:hypothetical protein
MKSVLNDVDLAAKKAGPGASVQTAVINNKPVITGVKLPQPTPKVIETRSTPTPTVNAKESQAKTSSIMTIQSLHESIEQAKLGIGLGIYEGASSAVDGIVYTAKHPIKTAVGVYHLVGNSPEDREFQRQVAESIKNQISTAYNEDVKNGDIQSQFKFFSRAAFEVGSAVFGTKGTTQAISMAKATKVTEVISPIIKVEIAIDTTQVVKTVVYGDQYTKVNGKKSLKTDVEYTTNEGQKFTTDSNGRISNAEATLSSGKADRNQYAQRTVGGSDRLPNDDGGHLIASIFKGSGEIDNLVPMDSTLNRSEYKILENTWKKALKDGKTVSVKIEPIYKGESSRPDKFEIEYKIDGKKHEVNLKNYEGRRSSGNQ